MSIRKQTKRWKTREGKVVRVCDMADSHLQNCRRMLERAYRRWCDENAAAALGYAYHPMTPDGASDAAERAYDQYTECAITLEGIEEKWPIYEALYLEEQRRGLKHE